METNFYSSFTLLGLFMFITMVVVFIWSERSRKKDDKKMASFMRFAHIESQKNSKNVQRIIDATQKDIESMNQVHKDNALFLRMIFERVDKPEENNG